MAKITKHKKILCLDFDGVIHSYSSGCDSLKVVPHRLQQKR
jgi:hypothetical protein